MTDHPADFFWKASAAARTHGDVAAGTMMGLPCLRVSGAFIAACDHRSGDLIVKLPRHRVQQLIATGAGKPFAPAGKTFREWLLVEGRDPARWTMLIDEARTYASRARPLPAHRQRTPAWRPPQPPAQPGKQSGRCGAAPPREAVTISDLPWF